MNYKVKVAEKLLEIGAVTLSPKSPYTWASGIKSPIYCDNRLTISYPEIRDLIAEGMKDLIEDKFSGVEVISGTATAGIPHAAFISQKMNLPMTYVRSSSKGHGKKNQVEGKLEKEEKVVVVEDLISTGGSSLKVVDVLKENEVNVLGLVAIFTYNFKEAVDRFDEKKVKFYTLTDYNTLIEVALNKGYISEEELEILKEWKKAPKTYYRK
ncbi:orotate phosphoribosyltransferase [Haliovirga abyssi]|uniref:Orotate phosphoribosyltransferase n=1 Tax=Haliovirga abyssi TaxID=2996794 RepID=A0AAU9DDZ5_9FUSO|nr:orotate phosphoribosyltransferase [Haliovirga abyssi]BDU50567.1 orotate phosphoribosyltransferase [Haliovirga abyssi]